MQRYFNVFSWEVWIDTEYLDMRPSLCGLPWFQTRHRGVSEREYHIGRAMVQIGKRGAVGEDP